MKKKIFIILWTLFLITCGAFYVVNKFILPAKLKSILTEKIQETTGRKTSIADVQFSLVKGFIIKGLVLSNRDETFSPFLRADQIALHILYPPIFKEKKIIIPTLNIENPDITLVRNKDNRWNFSDILDKQIQAQRPPSQSPFSVAVLNISIHNASVHFSDHAALKEFSETIQNLNLDAKFTLPQNIKLSASGVTAQKPTTFAFDGTYQLSSQSLTGQLGVENFPVSDYLPSYYIPPNFELANGTIRKSDINIHFQNNVIKLKGKAQSTGIVLKFPSGFVFSGSPSAEFTAELNIQQPDSINYTALVELNHSSLSGIPYIQSAKDLNGQIRATPNEISSKKIDLTILNSNFSVAATVKDLSQPLIDLALTSQNIDLNDLNPLLSNISKGKPLSLQGHGPLTLSFEGQLSPGKDSHVNISTRLIEFKLESTDPPLNVASQQASVEVKYQGPFPLSSHSRLELTSHLSGVSLQSKSPDIAAGGNVTIALDFQGPFPISENTQYNLSAQLGNAAIKLTSPAVDLENVNGKLSYDSKRLVLENVTAHTLGTDVNVSGSVEDLTSPLLNVRVSSDHVDMGKISALFPDLLKQSKIKKIDGISSIDMTYQGRLSDPLKANLNVAANVSNASITVDGLPNDITNISGKLSAQADFARWEFETSLSSDFFSLQTKVKMFNNVFDILLLKGNYLKVPFDVQGRVTLADGTFPSFEMTAKSEIDLESISAFAPPFKDQLDPFKPTGHITVDSKIKGHGQDWHEWQMSANVTSPLITVMGYKFNSVNFTMNQLPSANAHQINLTANVYEGLLKVGVSADLKEKGIPSQVSASLDKVNLSLFKNDTPAKEKNITGFLSGTFYGEAPLEDFKKIKGRGSLLVNNGTLWQLNLLKGLGKLLLIPEFENIVFTEASGTFDIADERILTGDLQLISQQAKLLCAGWMDFNQKVNFDINAEFSDDTIASSESLKKSLTAILTQGNNLLGIKLTGSLKEPKYTLSKTAIIRKATDLLINGLKSIFE